MCKVFMVAGIKKENVDKVWRFAKAIAHPMSRINDDGLGYAAITKDGNLFGERWLNNSHAFGKEVEVRDKKVLDVFGKAISTTESSKVITSESNSFGVVDRENIVAITMHTRMATSPKGMMNTHPFVEDNVSLIHNGVIRNYEDFGGRVTTCDSEAILKAYLEEKVREDVSNIKNATKRIKGYYACGVLTNTESGPILDIFKSTGARLHVAFVEDLDAYVLSTDNDDIKNTCKELGYSIGQVFAILPGKCIRVDAVTGKEMSITDFEEAPEYNGYSRNFPQTRTSTTGGNSGNATETTVVKKESVKEKVFPFKKKGNTHITDSMMDYFRSGERHIVALSEREIQEEIMNQERFFGQCRW